MEVTTLTALAGVLGSVTGASATVATAWITQRTRNKRELLEVEISKREALYGEFISESVRLLADAFIHSLDQPDALLPLYALVNRIRLRATPRVLGEAEIVVARITEQYFSENLTVAQVRDLTRSKRADPMMAFGEACRAEFKSMLASI
jgi:hypothetical protein